MKKRTTELPCAPSWPCCHPSRASSAKNGFGSSEGGRGARKMGGLAGDKCEEAAAAAAAARSSVLQLACASGVRVPGRMTTHGRRFPTAAARGLPGAGGGKPSSMGLPRSRTFAACAGGSAAASCRAVRPSRGATSKQRGRARNARSHGR